MSSTPNIAILGAGIAGLAVARAILDLQPGARLNIYEASDRAGGKLKTEIVESAAGRRFFIENGPNGVLDNQPSTIALAERLGIGGQMLQSSDDARRRYVYLRGKLRKLPESPPAFITSDLISWPGKLRAAREWFVRVAPPELSARETVAEYTIRRLGPEVLHAMVEPFVTGVFAGDPRRLELATAFPRMQQLEREYGGLLRALVRIERERRRAARAGNPKPKTMIRSFQSGMGELAGALEKSLQKVIVKNARAAAVIPQAGGDYLIQFDRRESARADIVVFAAPAAATAALLGGIAPEAAAEMLQIEYAPIAVVALGFDDPAARPPALDGFGFLVARGESLQILGALCESSIWPRGGGGFLVRCMVGGTRAPHLLQLSDAELLEIVRGDLRNSAGLAAEPSVARVVRWPAAIPQYNAGHAARVERIESALAAHPRLLLAGAAWRGVSVNDLCKRAPMIAAQVATLTTTISRAAES